MWRPTLFACMLHDMPLVACAFVWRVIVVQFVWYVKLEWDVLFHCLVLDLVGLHYSDKGTLLDLCNICYRHQVPLKLGARSMVASLHPKDADMFQMLLLYTLSLLRGHV